LGDVVEVSGLVQSDGSINATRIERAPAGAQYGVSGTVSGNQATQGIFLLNAQVVDYRLAQLQGVPGNVIGNGQRVLVKGSLVNGVLEATRVEYLGNVFAGASGEGREVEGLITRFASSSDFDVSGLPVTTTSQTVYEEGTAASLALNVKVEVAGQLNDAGVLVASRIDVRRSASVRIVTSVDSVNAAAGSLVALGVTIKIDALTRLEDQSDLMVRPFSLANLAVGDYVEVRGAESPIGSGEVLATLVQRTNSQQDTQLQGFVQSVAAPSFTVLGVQVTTNGSTQFDGVSGVSKLAVGDLVQVSGQKVADRALNARTVEIDD
jgi:hypothetical protein